MSAANIISLKDFPQITLRRYMRNDLLRSLYARVTDNALFFNAINRRYIKALSQLPPPELTEVGKRVVRDLGENGIAFAHISEFFQPEFFDVIKSTFDTFLEEFHRLPSSEKGKAVFIDTIHKAHTFSKSDSVSTYCGLPAFASIAAHYMGLVPRFVGSSFWRTRVAPENDRIYSQLWHRDYNDRMLVKVFLYVSDVGDKEGYFEYLTQSHWRGLLGCQLDKVGSDGLRVYPNEDELEGCLANIPVINLSTVQDNCLSGDSTPWHGKPTVIRCQAPKGTLIFADTFGIHRGGHVE